MMRKVPVLPTLLVLAAVALMIYLGLWQIDRLHQKERLLAIYAKAGTEVSAPGPGQPPTPLPPFPQSKAEAEGRLYRHTVLYCDQVIGMSVIAGHNLRGETGMAHVADCRIGRAATARVVLGWSRDPKPAQWHGGKVSGMIAPGPRLVADPPLAGLEANARPDPADILNNHLAYAVQWFLFALTALVIYGIAVWKRMRG
jgi:surfeit locus 1 family protein